MVNFNEEQKIIIELAEETPITTEVNDINHIPSYKIAEEERRANEQQRIANENEREKFYNEFQDKVNRGEFDGADSVYVGSEPPTDEDVTVWLDPNGTPEVEAKNIYFADKENLQTKYENGELKGEKGDKGADGTMSFNDLTEEQKASLKGDKGDTGANGKDGIDGYTPIKGVDYFTDEDIASLNIPAKTSDLNNDSGYLKLDDIANYVVGQIKYYQSGTLLYENSSGETGQLLLHYNISKYATLDIYYGELYEGNLYNMSMKTLPVVNGEISNIPLEIVTSNSNSTGMILFSKVISISGMSLTVQRELKVTMTSSGNTFNTDANIGILKIVGHEWR